MDFVEKTGKTVDEAVTAALIELGVSSDQVNIEIVDEGTKGILGLFSKEAKVRVSLKSSDQGETVEKEIEEEVIVRAVEKATGEKMVAEAIKNGMAAKASFDKYGIM